MFDLTTDEARLLLNVALMATGANRFQSAAKIFAVLEKFRPSSPSVSIGKAILLISAQKYAEAVEYIDGEALGKFPDNAMLFAFKGMALKKAGREQEASEALFKASEQTVDPAAAQLAKGLME